MQAEIEHGEASAESPIPLPLWINRKCSLELLDLLLMPSERTISLPRAFRGGRFPDMQTHLASQNLNFF